MRVINHQKLQNKLDFHPHAKQLEVLKNLKQFNVINCGRRFGKSTLIRYIIFSRLLLPKQQIWVVAPTYSLSDEIWNGLYFWALEFGDGWVDQIDKSKRLIRTKGQSTLEVKSADNPASLRGKGNTLLVLEEAAMITSDIFYSALYPTTTDKKGQIIAISTPRGSGWFKDYFYLGQSNDPENADYYSIQLPTIANPFIDPKVVEEAKRTLPAEIFRQEYLAEFIADGGTVFRNIEACSDGEFQEPIYGVTYKVSADLAKHEDFTVIMVGRTDTKEVVYHERFNNLDWPIQRQKILTIASKYNNASVILDATGPGDVFYDDIKNSGIDIEPFKFTNLSKNTLIENLVATMDDKGIHYPKIDVLISELELFGYKITSSKNIQYNAPSGVHDDEVIALALLNKKLNEPTISFTFL